MAINFRSNTVVSNLSIGPTIGTPIVNLFSNQTEINESGTVTFSITTENIEAGTLIPYSITGVTTTDISPSPLSGNFVVGTTETISITAVNDEDTDGDKTMVMTLPSNGNLTASCIVRDTSQTPPPVTSATYENLMLVGGSYGSIAAYDTSDLSLQPRYLSPSNRVGNRNYFGYSFAQNGSQVVVGDIGDEAVSRFGGAVHVFNQNNLAATPTKIVTPSSQVAHQFGVSVAATSDKIIVGTPYDETHRSQGGALYVYNASNLSASPTVLTISSANMLGWVLATSSSKLVAGSLHNKVYIYDINNLAATPTTLQLGSYVDGTAQGGNSVAVTSNHLVAGAWKDSTNGDRKGAVLVYNVNNLSATPTKLAPSGLDNGDVFGASVAATTSYLAVGAPNDGDQGSSAGAVYVYNINNLSATPTKLTPSDLGSNDTFGHSLNISGNKLAVGAKGELAVYIYDLTNLSAAPTKIVGGIYNFGRGVGMTAPARNVN